jgi:hypothetical protein
MAGKFEVYRDSRGEYRFRLKAANGEIVAQGEGYSTKSNAPKECPSEACRRRRRNRGSRRLGPRRHSL